MTRFILCLLTLATATLCHAEVTKLSTDDQKVLRDISRFQEIKAATNLPPTVFALCADGNGKLAERGQKWQVTDVVTDETLPWKRFIWAVTDGDYYVVHYERGGISHSHHIIIARLKTGESKARFVWHGVGEPLKDYSAFVEALPTNKLHDELDFTH